VSFSAISQFAGTDLPCSDIFTFFWYFAEQLLVLNRYSLTCLEQLAGTDFSCSDTLLFFLVFC
jgi:hypothetical protein